MSRRAHMGAVASLTALAVALAGAPAADGAGPGALDPSFGTGGVASTGSGTQLFGVAVQANGEVVAAGQSGGAVLVERLTPGGQPAGEVVGAPGVARAVAVQSDGKIVVAGVSGGMFAERFNANGTVDTGFGSNGVARATALGGSGAANAVAIGPDGKVVLAGSVGSVDTRIALARFNANGSPDAGFGSGGAEVVDLGLPYAVAQGVAVQHDGKIVFVGHEQGDPHFGFFNGLVARLSANGPLDPSFNGSGVVSYHKSGGNGSGYDTLNAVVLQNDGKIVAGGADVGGPYAVFLRLNPTGAFDASFGSGGEAALSSGSGTSLPVGANGVAIAGGGRIVGAGAVQQNGTDFRAGLWSFTPSGSADPSFGSGGIVKQPGGAEACALAIAPDGSLVVAGDTVSAIASNSPCTVVSGGGGSSPSGFVARYIGYGPTPPPTPPGAVPAVSTGAGSGVSEVSAVVAGQTNPEGLATFYHFDYGRTAAYGSSTLTASAGSGASSASVSAILRGLHPGTKYHYRLVAANSAGTAFGADRSLRTAPPLSAGIRGVARSYSLSSVVNRGLALTVSCSQACVIKGSLVISRGTAKALGLGKHPLTIGSGSASLTRGGTARLLVHLTKAAKRALVHRRNLSPTLKIVTTPVGGGQVVTLSKPLALKR